MIIATTAVRHRRGWLAGTAIAAMAAVPALAQTPAAPAPQATAITTAEEAPAEDLVITGSRIARSGYDAPTPVAIVTETELKAEPQANISDYINTLPPVRGSQSSSTSSGSLSNGQAGINSVNLRALGAQRTLVPIDGQRSVASTTVGIVDTQTIPQGLIKGVEVVTGGASPVYGSDAVSGVVNFILNRDYEGFRAEYEYGVTTYGDVPNHNVRLTAGIPFAGGRGKILLAGDYFQQTGVDTYDRKWQDAGLYQIGNPACVAGNGQPERFVGSGIGTYQFTPGGIVNSGPLRGTYFGTINAATGQATPNQFNYGPTRGVAGIPTAFTATWGEGGPMVALGSDIDGLLGLSQYPGTAGIKPMVEGAPGHGEGHNSGMPLMVVAALAAEDGMVKHGIKGRLMLWPGVAEELLATKAYYVRAGMFKDVDASIFVHVERDFNTA